MTPAPLRPESVQRRLAEIAVLLDMLDRHRHVTAADLEHDLERRLAIERALSQVVDLAVKINAHTVTSCEGDAPADYHTSFTAAGEHGVIDAALAARLAPSAGLRNRLVHEYEDIDLAVVAAALPDAVEGFRAYARAVADWLARRLPGPTSPGDR